MLTISNLSLMRTEFIDIGDFWLLSCYAEPMYAKLRLRLVTPFLTIVESKHDTPTEGSERLSTASVLKFAMTRNASNLGPVTLDAEVYSEKDFEALCQDGNPEDALVQEMNGKTGVIYDRLSQSKFVAVIPTEPKVAVSRIFTEAWSREKFKAYTLLAEPIHGIMTPIQKRPEYKILGGSIVITEEISAGSYPESYYAFFPETHHRFDDVTRVTSGRKMRFPASKAVYVMVEQYGVSLPVIEDYCTMKILDKSDIEDCNSPHYKCTELAIDDTEGQQMARIDHVFPDGLFDQNPFMSIHLIGDKPSNILSRIPAQSRLFPT